MEIKKDLIVFLNENEINFTDCGPYVDLTDKNVRLYPIEDLYAHRFGMFHDKGNGVSKNYFSNISLENEKHGIRTIWIKAFEWGDERQQNVLKSYILSASGKIQTRIYARDTEVREIPVKELRAFLDKNCFYGWRAASLYLGLYLKKDINGLKKGDLLMCYTFGKAHYGKGRYDVEVIRAATLLNTQVIGGASKLWKHFVTKYPVLTIASNEIPWNGVVFYVDFDHNSGNAMTALGFDFSHHSGGGSHNIYADTQKAFPRTPARHKEIMQDIRDNKVYCVPHAGTKVFIYNKQNEKLIEDNSHFTHE